MTENELILSKLEGFTNEPLASYKHSPVIKQRVIDRVKEHLSTSNVSVETALVWINSELLEFDEEEKEHVRRNEYRNAYVISKETISTVEEFRSFIQGADFSIGRLYRFSPRFYFDTLKTFKREGEFSYFLNYNHNAPENYYSYSTKKEFELVVSGWVDNKEDLIECIVEEVESYIPDYVSGEDHYEEEDY
ncbi:MAG: hypothetical protein EOO46_17775 [Flavobacterium sp.]|nr:MAG: hypothetical protein EOO46_17775 [Flavobacterium sp.]